jgi:PhnB protein
MTKPKATATTSATPTYHEVFPYLRVKRAGDAIDFYKRAFGVAEKFRLVEPSGRIGHCELAFGGAIVMVSEEYPELGILGPQSIGGTSASIHLHVDNADALIDRAVSAGATLVRPPQDQFYGERSGTIRDPFGHEWLIGHHLEDVSPEEMQRRYDAVMKA